MSHSSYNPEELEQVKYSHVEPKCMKDKLAYWAVINTKRMFDWVSGYNPETMVERHWINRAIFLETIAGVPGMVGGMQRHMRSLRTLERDHGWIHQLLSEAENERMHLFFFLQQRHPGVFFRLLIAFSQAFFFNAYFLLYSLSPKMCHRFVGYLEEEAVRTYTVMLKCLDDGKLKHWQKMDAPRYGKHYY
jgi:hypothetical protein